MVPRPAQHLHLDFETYCDLDLKKVGVHRYVEHASFAVMAVGWKWAGVGEQTRFKTPWLPGEPTLPFILRRKIEDPAVQVHAWNAAFETAVLERLGVKPARPLSCTMQR